MKKFLFRIIPAVLLLAACSQENELAIKESPTQTAKSTHISLEDALKNAEGVFISLEGDATRTASRTVRSVEMLGSDITRSSESEALYYVVNYDNEAGFAVLGADTRLDEVYAISEEGSLNMNDTVFNGGLNIFFRSLPTDLDGSVGDSGWGINQNDSTKLDISDIKPLYNDASYKVGPFLAPTVRKWTQDGNFAYYTPNNYPVGCAALASAMLMSAYNWPSSYNGYEYNWGEMKAWSGGANFPLYSGSVPRLLMELGKTNNLDIEYHANGSSAYTETTLPGTFRNFNYRVLSEFSNMSEQNLIDLIDDKVKPVICRGGMYDDNGNRLSGHVWVCDGYFCKRRKYETTDGVPSYSVIANYFHLVWGWGGSANGYFKLGDTFVVNHSVKESDDTSKESWNSGRWDALTNYRHLRFFGDVTPNK